MAKLIEEFGFGKGYVEALGNWRRYRQANSCAKKNMAVCQIAHAEQKAVNQPDTEPFDRWQIKLNERASDLVQEHADLVGFCNTKTVIKSGARRSAVSKSCCGRGALSSLSC